MVHTCSITKTDFLMYFYSAQYKTSRRALDGSGNEFNDECILGYFTSFEEGMQYLQDFYKASNTYIEYIDKVITTKRHSNLPSEGSACLIFEDQSPHGEEIIKYHVIEEIKLMPLNCINNHNPFEDIQNHVSS